MAARLPRCDQTTWRHWSSALSSHEPESTRQLIDDVILGCTNQAGEDNRNVARMATLIAGLPETVPGQTVNRLCASGLQAIASAAQAIAAGEGTVFVAGGVESMTRSPLHHAQTGQTLCARRSAAGRFLSRMAIRQSQSWRRVTIPTPWEKPPKTSSSVAAYLATRKMRSPPKASDAPASQ